MCIFVMVERQSGVGHRHLQLAEKLLHSAVEQRLQLSDKRLFVRMFSCQTSFVPDQVKQETDVAVSDTPDRLKCLLQQQHSSLSSDNNLTIL